MPATQKMLSLLLSVLLIFSDIAPGYARSVEKQSVLAVLTLNIARFTHWPEQVFNDLEATLRLCVIGDNIVQQSFENIDHKVVNNKTIQIINLSRLRNPEQCQLLYISTLEHNKLILLLAELQGQAILTVGEDMAFLQAGGMVGLDDVNGKIQLNINLPIVKQSELVISSRLLKLANIVDFPNSAH